MTLKIREICGNSWLKCSYTKSFNKFIVIPVKVGIHDFLLWIPE